MDADVFKTLPLAGVPLFMALDSMHASLLVSWNLISLPLLVLWPLRMAPRICARLVATPLAEEAVTSLYRILDTIQ